GGYMAEHHVPGLALAVARAGEPELLRGYGYANVELSVAAAPDTVFEIASITKTFTAAAVLILCQDGAAALSDPIGRHLPDLPPAWRPVTLLQLVTHTSGIRDYTAVPSYWTTTRLDVPREAMVALVRDLPLDFTPGTDWAYSSTGYHLLGMLIEGRSGSGYGEFLRDRIFEPLGMHDTRLNDPYEVVPRRAAGYAWRGSVLRNKEYYSPSGTWAAGGLLSTVADLARWDRAYATGVLARAGLHGRSADLGRTPTPAERANGFTMGLGWYQFGDARQGSMRHNGSVEGFASEMSRYSPSGLTVVVCCNSGSAGSLHLLADEIAACRR
ncbi:MAG TPA: serine hydrolase domain-containing protein, partial [Longimicrobium sp.]|nr:serine hydrolase domain-containing protein [Longimicrobium sp.]